MWTKDLQNISNEILSKVDKCQDNVKFLVSSLESSMQKKSSSDGKHGGVLDTCQSYGEVLIEIKRVIENHSQSFFPKMNGFLPPQFYVDTTIIRTINSKNKSKDIDRLIPEHEN